MKRGLKKEMISACGLIGMVLLLLLFFGVCTYFVGGIGHEQGA